MPERQKVESQVISLNTDFSLPMPESSHPNALTACQFAEKIEVPNFKEIWLHKKYVSSTFVILLVTT